jgi:spermidine synthase
MHKVEQPEKFLFIASLVFFLSGSSALIFETTWFHVMGIVLGSSVWSAAAVLSAFMTGLAMGNSIMAASGHRLQALVKIYVVIELVIAISGVSVIFAAPYLTPWIAGLLSLHTDNQALLNFSRFAIAFILLLGPTVAMGMTLPVLQKLLYRYNPDFIQSLGRLYGWNTIGAVSGTLVAEFLLIHYVGIKSAALTAAVCNFAAAFVLMRHFGLDSRVAAGGKREHILASITGSGRLFIPPFVTGLLLLALEILWFRCLLLLNIGSSIIFAIMLAVVLAGIGIGGLLVSRFKFQPAARDRLLIYLPPVAALFVVLGYYLYNALYAAYLASGTDYTVFIAFSLLLMLPTCIVSGILFPLYGDQLFTRLRDETRASGMLTLANTVGAALGSALATFWLLPRYGLENSIFILALGYLLAVIPQLKPVAGRQTLIRQLTFPAAALLIIVLAFPFGAMSGTHKTYGELRFPNARLVMIREGLNETSKYYQYEKFGKPIRHRLVTNSYSMSGTDFVALRYMQMFVYLPYIFNQDIRKVLQISYGVGNTAEAVISLDSVEQFDVVDISEDIFNNSSIIHDATGRYPLRDPRTRMHVEDGRFFLQTAAGKYDLITAEPPPPQQAGVVNLYTQEYFTLIRARLETHGLASYWLPLNSLRERDAMAIVKAFCLAFPDCSLWAGGGLDLILLGSNGGIRPQSAESFGRPWQAASSRYLADIGLEMPGQVGPLFLADAPMLSTMTLQVEPVTDNYPHRISPNEQGKRDFSEFYASLLDIERRKKAFAGSAYIKSIFPPAIMEDALGLFHYENLLAGRITERRYMNLDSYFWEELADILTGTELETLPLLLLNSNPREQYIIDAVGYASDPEALLAYAKRRLTQRQYREAAVLLQQYIELKGGFANATRESQLYMLARALDGNPVELPLSVGGPEFLEFQNWCYKRFGRNRRM